jgi:hypothetical protein
MKATDFIKKSQSSKEIYEEIEKMIEHNPNHFKFFIPHFIYVSNDVQVELLKMGFKITHGEWFRGDTGLIIEW